MTARRGSMTEVDASFGWQLVVSGALVFVTHEAEPATWHPYVPASVGDRWEFSLSQGAAAATEAVDTVIAAARQGDRLVARLRSAFVGATFERDLVISPLGVSPEVGAMTTPFGTVTTTATEGLYLPRTLNPGQRWRWRQQLEAPTSTTEAVGRCAVVGEALFEGLRAVHVHCEMRSLMTLKDATAPTEHVQNEDNYYVYGLGLVRSVTTTSSGYHADKRLLRWTVAGAPAASSGARNRAEPEQ